MENSFTGDSAMAGRRSELFFWSFAVVALCLFLGHNALWASEGRWAEIVREMQRTGDLLHPSINWRICGKPNLTSWLGLPFAALFGGASEWVVRLPGVLAGLAGLYGTLLLGKKLFDRRTALLAGWMLLSSYGFLFWSRNAAAPADIAALASTVLAVALYHQREERGGFWSFLGFYLICFCGVLAGGIPVLVMPFVVLAPHLAAEGRWRRFLGISPVAAFLLTGGGYLALFHAAAVLPPVSSLELPPESVSTGILQMLREDFLRPATELIRGKPGFAYLCHLPRCLLPWCPLIVVAIAGLVRNWKDLSDTLRELLTGALLLFVFFLFLSPRRWYSVLPLLPFCTLLGAVGASGPAGVEKWNRFIWQLMHFLVITAASLAVASLVAIPLWYRFVPFKPPLLLLVGLPVAGVLTLCVMMFDSRSDGMLERLTGMPFRFGAPLLGGAILTVALFDCVLPSFTIYRSEKPFYREFRKSAGVSPSRFFCWGEKVPAKLLFYLDFAGPVADSEADFRSEKGRSTPVDSEAEFRARLARLSAFLTRNAGVPVAVMAGCRSESAESFARAVRELRLPIDLKNPNYSEAAHKVMKMENDDRCRNIWLFTAPGKTEEQQ